MRTVLVIYYSWTGTSRRLAQLLAAAQGWPTGEILEERPRSGAIGTVRCVLDSLLHRHPSVRYAGPDPGEFDTVVLMGPIWANRLCGPLRSFVAANSSHLRSYAIASTMGSTGPENAEAELRRLIGRSPLVSAPFRAREVDDGSCAAAVRAFGQFVAGNGGEAARPAELSPQAA